MGVKIKYKIEKKKFLEELVQKALEGLAGVNGEKAQTRASPLRPVSTIFAVLQSPAALLQWNLVMTGNVQKSTQAS